MIPVRSSVIDGGNKTQVFEVLEGVASGSQYMIEVVEVRFVP